MKQTPLRRVSKRQAAKLAIYYQLKREFLEAHPHCQWPGCTSFSQDIHHKAGRGRNLNNTDTWEALCRIHHHETHHRPGEARKAGHLI